MLHTNGLAPHPEEQSGPPFWYRLYGLLVRSEFRLPTPETGRPPGEAPVLEFRAARPGLAMPEPDGVVVATDACVAHGVNTRVHRGPGGAWIWNRGIGTCHVLPDARTVVGYPDPGSDPRGMGLILAGQVSVFILHQMGRPTLHASGVVTEHGALAFLGPPRHGKSSMAAAFLKHGASMITDDVLPLMQAEEGIYATPSVPYMKLWPHSVEAGLDLDHQDLPTFLDAYDKRLLLLEGRFSMAEAPARMRALYLLHRYDPEAEGTTETFIQPLGARDGLAVVLAQVSKGAYLLPREAAAFLPFLARLVGQAPVRLLRYPNGFEHQTSVIKRIVADTASPDGGYS